MKKLTALIILSNVLVSATAQIYQPTIYSAAQQKASNMSKQKVDCIWGDCVNGIGRLLVNQKYAKKTNRDEQRFSIDGQFKDGLLNGFGKVTRYFIKDPPVKKGIPYDSLAAIEEVYSSLNTVYNLQNGLGHEGAFGYFKNGILLEGTYINDYGTVMTGIFYRSSLIFGSIKWQNSEEEYRGFTTSINTGLGIVYKKDSMEFYTHRFQKKITDFKPLSSSEYTTGREYVIRMRFEDGFYSGEAYQGLPEGLGEWISDDHQHAKFGYFKNGKIHGLAALNFNKDDKYKTMCYLLGLFKNGVIQRASVAEEGVVYVGEVNEKFIADGYGSLYNYSDDGGKEVEYGKYSQGQIHGYGVRKFYDGSVQIGNFNYGKFTGGTEIITVNSLRSGDIIKINGNKLMVIDNPWYDHSITKAYRGWVTLSDKSQLKEGMKFEKLKESNDAFFKRCPKCLGFGNINEYTTEKVLVSGSTFSTYKQYTGANTAPKEVTVALGVPVYGTKLTTKNVTCPECNGSGKVLK